MKLRTGARDVMPIELGTSELAVVIDPARGGVISSAVARRPGVELLFQAPWPAGALELAGQSEEAWTTAWRGGWNVLFPNAGAACFASGTEHPFHGAASFTPWSLLDQSDASARLRWASTDGLTLERKFTLDGGTLHVANVVRNEGSSPAPYLLVEHLILGGDVLAPSTRIQIEAGRVIELANEGHRTGRVDEWPHILRDGVTDDWSTRPSDQSARFGAVDDLAERALGIDVPDQDLALRLSWSDGFPYLWFWEERARENAPPWNRQAVCLGLEPSTSATGEGLAAALERGDSPVLEAGAEARTETVLEVIT